MSALLVLLLAACRVEPPTNEETACPKGTCADTVGEPDCGDAEIWCDGIDQDCDGADATEEIPYDGVDQDCDGRDLVDADGDGHDAEVVGGDDCDDNRPDVYPGASEVADDNADNDCDGRTDEVAACADGTGDAASIQEAVDSTPQGGVVEICPGRWTEKVRIVDRRLTLMGGGAMPGDTVLDSSDGTPAVVVSGVDADVTLDWLSLQGDDLDDELVGFEDAPTVTLRRIDVSDDGGPTAGWIELIGHCEGEGALTVELSRFRGIVTLSGTCVRDVSMVGNTLSGDAVILLGYSTELAEFRNNVVVGDAVEFQIQYGTDFVQGGRAALVANNVFSAGAAEFVATISYGEDTGAAPPVLIQDNIVQGVVFGAGMDDVVYGGLVYSGYLALPCEDTHPIDTLPLMSANLLWDSVVPEPEGFLRCSGGVEGAQSWSDTTTFTAAFAAGFTNANPQFVFDSGRGSYGLAGESPAVDAGAGDADPDGSPNDIGAFGGPDGNWYLEYPWPLD